MLAVPLPGHPLCLAIPWLLVSAQKLLTGGACLNSWYKSSVTPTPLPSYPVPWVQILDWFFPDSGPWRKFSRLPVFSFLIRKMGIRMATPLYFSSMFKLQVMKCEQVMTLKWHEERKDGMKQKVIKCEYTVRVSIVP